MWFVTLTVDIHWVGFRGGQLFFVLAPALVARGFVRLWDTGLKRAAIALGLFVAATGSPTTVIDAYNAQDVWNRKMGPGFHWTVALTPAEQEALEWIRTNTRPRAVVQAEPMVRGRETWSLIPTFAERRMAAGNALPLLGAPGDAEQCDRVRQIYASADAATARRLAKSMGIEYLYVDATERRAYPDVSKFDAYPQWFERVFANTEVSVYAVW